MVGFVAIAKETIKLADAKGFVNLTAKGRLLIADAHAAPDLPIAHPERNTIMARLSLFQLEAMRAFIAGVDIAAPTEEHWLHGEHQ
jgi:hypothetical protein